SFLMRIFVSVHGTLKLETGNWKFGLHAFVLLMAAFNLDALIKNRHSGENRSTDRPQFLKKTGFRVKSGMTENGILGLLRDIQFWPSFSTITTTQVGRLNVPPKIVSGKL
ncbi:MAG: hypothetical protein U9R17_03360, partial [Thermodesulfobacteriota bacterium]|nr:hypothetical protein [Thermodesulfobacteriota bacterium]